jgi:triosephosphate isomerase
MAVRLLAQGFDIFEGDGLHPFARTGRISCQHLKDAGAFGVILGHSEVNDAPEIVGKKLKAALKIGLKENVLLVGEKWEELGADWDIATLIQKETAKAAVRNRLIASLEEISADDFSRLVLGYEPAWGTRGSGKKDAEPPQPEQVGEFCAFIRAIISEKYGEDAAKSLRVIYGGTMSPERAAPMMDRKDVDGFILGSAGTRSDWVRNIAAVARNYAKPGRTPVLVLNWKAYNLKEPYIAFVEDLKKFEIDSFVAPNFVDLRLVGSLVRMQ